MFLRKMLLGVYTWVGVFLVALLSLAVSILVAKLFCLIIFPLEGLVI